LIEINLSAVRDILDRDQAADAPRSAWLDRRQRPRASIGARHRHL